MLIQFKVKDINFVYNVLPNIIQKQVLDRYKKIKFFKKDKDLNDYLKDNFNTDLDKIILQLRNIVQISKFKDMYVVGIKQNYIDIINLIDFGNRELSGLHIVDSSLKYILNNLSLIYNHYLKGGLLHVN